MLYIVRFQALQRYAFDIMHIVSSRCGYVKSPSKYSHSGMVTAMHGVIIDGIIGGGELVTMHRPFSFVKP